MLAMTLPANLMENHRARKARARGIEGELLRHLILLHHGVLLVHHAVGLLHLVGRFGHRVGLFVHLVRLLLLGVLHRRLHGVFGEGRRSESQSGRNRRGKNRLYGSPSLGFN